MYNCSKKPGNSDSFHLTKGWKITATLKRNWGNKEQFVRKAKSWPVDWDCGKSQRTLRMLRAIPSNNQSPFELLCSHCEISYVLVCPFFSTFLLPLHYSLALSLPLYLLLTPSAVFLGFSLFPSPISATSLLLFSLSWMLQSIIPPFPPLPHLCSLTPLPLSFMSGYWSRPLLSRGGCYSYQ